MSRLTITVLSLYMLFAITHTWEHLSESKFHAILGNDDGAIVVACDKKSEHLEKEWSLAILDARLPFIGVDCVASLGICSLYGVSSSSTVKLFEKGQVQIVVQWPSKGIGRVRPDISQFSIVALEDFKKADETGFIEYLNMGDDTSRVAFAEVLQRYREEFTFAMSTDASVFEVEKVTPPVVKCYKPLDGDTQQFTDFSDAGALDEFIKEASRPIIGELLPHNHQRFLDSGWIMVYVFAATEIERYEIRQALTKLARSYYEMLTMVTVDPLEFPDLPAKLGLDPEALPAGAVHQLSRDRVYPSSKEKDWTSNELQGWGLDVWQGRIRPWTPPGVTITYKDMDGRIKATRKVSIANIPGVNVRVAGRDEL
ncbi:thioredoxin-like domain-containing protein [Jackrogersella minutella]|nr:thioredoxin-like domain-containing protein [Jackrogersella minutella]